MERQVSYRLTAADHVRNLRAQQVRPLLGIAALAVALGSLGSASGTFTRTQAVLYVALIGGVLFGYNYTILPILRVRALIRQSPALTATMTVSLRPDGLALAGPGQVLFPWRQVSAIRRTSAGVVVTLEGAQQLLLPAHAFSTPDCLEAFVAAMEDLRRRSSGSAPQRAELDVDDYPLRLDVSYSEQDHVAASREGRKPLPILVQVAVWVTVVIQTLGQLGVAHTVLSGYLPPAMALLGVVPFGVSALMVAYGTEVGRRQLERIVIAKQWRNGRILRRATLGFGPPGVALVSELGSSAVAWSGVTALIERDGAMYVMNGQTTLYTVPSGTWAGISGDVRENLARWHDAGHPGLRRR